MKTKIDILMQDYFKSNDVCSFADYADLVSQSDPGFFRWWYDDETLDDFEQGTHNWKRDLEEFSISLEDIADYINSADEWPMLFESKMLANGFVSDCGETYGVCHNANGKVLIDEEGQCYVTTI